MAWRVLPWALDTGHMSYQRSQVLGEPVPRNVSQTPSPGFGGLEGSCDHQVEDPGGGGIEVICKNSL